MTDVYRSSAFKCPSCRDAPLREFQGRLVCDECAGMLIEADDLAAAVGELDGSSGSLEVEPGEPTASACPRCQHAMALCSLRLGAMTIAGQFSCCARDGIWFPRDAMTALFARVSRRGGFRGLGAVARGGHGQGVRGGGVDATAVSNMPSGHGGMSAAMGSIANAFGAGSPASSGLAISNWHDHRPRVHTLFVSAHKDRKLDCPACKQAPLAYRGDRWVCTTCAGSFVENAALAAMISEMSLQPWEPPASAGAPGERGCPICAASMTVEVLEAVTVDRCDAHGVWFDDHQLQAALIHASGEPVGLGGWLRRLFHRDHSAE